MSAVLRSRRREKTNPLAIEFAVGGFNRNAWLEPAHGSEIVRATHGDRIPRVQFHGEWKIEVGLFIGGYKAAR